jgi:PAS domain S-box-containing protein
MKRSEYQLPALKSAVYFFVFGFFWILLSDNFLAGFDFAEDTELRLQTYKGWLFITLTTLLIYFLVIRRIKELIKLKHKLQLNEKSLTVILENIGEGIISVDKNQKITSINKIAQHLTGFKYSDAINKPISEILNIVDFNSHEKITCPPMDNLASINDPKNHFILIDDKNREYRIILRVEKITDDDSFHSSTILAFRDITAKKNLENELHRWLNVYSSFIKYSIEGIYLFEFKKPIPVNLPEAEQIRLMDETTILRTCNDSFAKMYG